MKYVKKKIIVDAERFTEENKDQIYSWAKEIQANVSHALENGKPCLRIPTLEGEMTCSLGDYLIIEPFPTDWRKIYPCKPTIFESTYELLLNQNEGHERSVDENPKPEGEVPEEIRKQIEAEADIKFRPQQEEWLPKNEAYQLGLQAASFEKGAEYSYKLALSSIHKLQEDYNILEYKYSSLVADKSSSIPKNDTGGEEVGRLKEEVMSACFENEALLIENKRLKAVIDGKVKSSVDWRNRLNKERETRGYDKSQELIWIENEVVWPLQRIVRYHETSTKELKQENERLKSALFTTQLEVSKGTSEIALLKAESTNVLEWVAIFYGALKSLVELKEIKGKDGKTEEYKERQPKAWYLAKQSIDLWKKSDYGANLSLSSLKEQSADDGWISVKVEPELGGEYNVLYDLKDGNSDLVVSTMDFDKNKKKWYDTRGANIECKTVLKYRPLPSPNK